MYIYIYFRMNRPSRTYITHPQVSKYLCRDLVHALLERKNKRKSKRERERARERERETKERQCRGSTVWCACDSLHCPFSNSKHFQLSFQHPFHLSPFTRSHLKELAVNNAHYEEAGLGTGRVEHSHVPSITTFSQTLHLFFAEITDTGLLWDVEVTDAAPVFLSPSASQDILGAKRSQGLPKNDCMATSPKSSVFA